MVNRGLLKYLRQQDQISPLALRARHQGHRRRQHWEQSYPCRESPLLQSTDGYQIPLRGGYIR